MTGSFTLDDIKRVIDERFLEERKQTRLLVQEEIGAHFHSFIKDTFDPALDGIERRFDLLDDRVDRLAMDVSELRLDVRHVKQVLRGRDMASTRD